MPAILDFTEAGEKAAQAVEILKILHRTKEGQALIHTEKCLTDKEGYDFPCPICGATVDWDGSVNLPDKKGKESCAHCKKQFKVSDLKEKILGSGITKDMFVCKLCPACFDNKNIMLIERKRQLKAHAGFCNTCSAVFDADTRKELEDMMNAHPKHREFTIVTV